MKRHKNGSVRKQVISITIERNVQSVLELVGNTRDALRSVGFNVLSVTACHKRFRFEELKK